MTITALGTATAGVERETVFTGILTLTHNAATMILPTGVNIITAVGDVARWRSLGGGNWKCVGYERANGASLAVPASATIASPAITGPTTMTDPGTTLLTVTSTDAGSSNGPIINLIRDSASPAVNDIIGTIAFFGKDSGAASQSYAQIDATILDPTAASEDGRLRFVTTVAGSAGSRAYIGAGVYTASATGGDKGADTINAAEFYKNGALLKFQTAFESTQQTITAGGSLTLAHGLGSQPKLYLPVLQCTTADLGYSIGDETPINPALNPTDASDLNNQGISLVPDATNINVRFGSAATTTFAITRKDTGASGTATNTSWRLVVRAWV